MMSIRQSSHREKQESNGYLETPKAPQININDTDMKEKKETE